MTDSDAGYETANPQNEDDERIVTLDVRYESSEPSEIEYFHNTFGMMMFDVNGSTAILSDKWDRLGDGCLKDGYTRWVTTGDVLRSVQRLPFIDSVELEAGR